MAKHISIDFGTSNTVIAAQNMGIVLNEPSLAAINIKTNQLVAVGNEAKTLLGKTPKDIRVVAPIKNGAIESFDVANMMLKAFISGTFPKSTIRPKATVCVPEKITEVEKTALFECISRSGAKNSYTQEASVSSALGSGIDVSSPCGNMVLDIGGGKTCASVLSFGGIVATETGHFGGEKMDEAIVHYIKKNYGVKIGKKTAEEIKIALGTCNTDNKTFTAMGRDEISGLPKETTVTSDDVFYAISPQLSNIVDLIKLTLENTPSELTRDICQNGICLSGGVSCLLGLDKYIEKSVGINTYVSKSPFECAALGAIESFDRGEA